MEQCLGSYFLKNGQPLSAACFEQHLGEISDSVYEVIRIIRGVPLFWEKHVDRLYYSASLARIALTLSRQDIAEGIQRLLQFNSTSSGNYKLLIKSLPNNHDIRKDWFLYSIPYRYPGIRDYQQGVTAILFRAERKNPRIKAADLDLRAAIDLELKKHGAYEALLVDAHGYVTEGSRSNVLWVRDGAIYTASSNRILPGVTRDAILKLCSSMGIRVIEQEISLDQLILMEAVFITGTSPKVLPVKQIDNLEFDSASHPVVINIMEGYNRMIDDYCEDNPFE